MLPVRDVFFGFGVDVLLGQAKVYNVNDVLLLVALPSNQEVLWLHIPVDEVLGVDVLHPGDLGRKWEWAISAERTHVHVHTHTHTHTTHTHTHTHTHKKLNVQTISDRRVDQSQTVQTQGDKGTHQLNGDH